MCKNIFRMISLFGPTWKYVCTLSFNKNYIHVCKLLLKSKVKHEYQIVYLSNLLTSTCKILAKFVILKPFIAYYGVWVLLIAEGSTVTYSCQHLCHLVSCGELSHWQSYHIFFFLYSNVIEINKIGKCTTHVL